MERDGSGNAFTASYLDQLEQQLIGQWWPMFLTRFEPGFGPPDPREATTGQHFKLYVVLTDGREVPWAERHG